MDAAPPTPRHRRVRTRPALAIVGAIVLAAACTATGAAPSPPASTTSTNAPPASPSVEPSLPRAAASPSASATAPASNEVEAFPLTLVDETGTELELPAEPETIVSLTPAATETLFAIGVGDRVAGKVEDIANHPPEAADVPIVGTFAGVDVEKIVALEPDLVIAGGNGGTPDDVIERLRSLDVPVLVVYADDVDEVFADIEQIGEAVGEAKAAEQLTAGMRAGFEQVEDATRDLERPRVFYETGDQPAIYGVADDSFVAAMLELAGSDPITTGSSTVWEMSQERLVAEDPEIILLGDAAYGVTPEAVAARPGWSGLTAVRENAIRPIDDIVTTRPGPRLLDGLRALVAAIHPEVSLPSASPIGSGG